MEQLVDGIVNTLSASQQLDSQQKATIKYGLELVISMVLSVLLVMVVALPIGNLRLAMLVLVGNASLRIFSGGHHLKNMFMCALFGAGLLNIVALVSKYVTLTETSYKILAVITLASSLYSIIMLIPVDTPQAPIRVERKPKYKIRSAMIVLTWSICMIILPIDVMYPVTLGLLWQNFTLTTMGGKLISTLERVINYEI